MNSPLLALPGFEILTELGRGETGIVYRARCTTLDREVAIKVMLVPNEAEWPARAWWFRREAEAMASLCHPFIASIHMVAEQDGQPYYVRELVEGTTLERLVTDSTVDVSDYLGILARIATAAEFLHKQGCVHRNLRPSNILVLQEGPPKLIGFSRACVADGTPHHTTTIDVLGLQELLAWLYSKPRKRIPYALDRLRQPGAVASAAEFAKAIEDFLQRQR